MLIAHLRFPVAPQRRPEALAALLHGAAEVRAMQGCLAFQPFYDPADDAVLGVLHEWAREEDFNAYLASAAFQRLGAALRPMMTGAPVSRRFRAELLEVVH